MTKSFLDTAHEQLSATGGYDAASNTANDYTSNNPGAGILKDARFVRDLHDFYRDRDGKSFSNDQEAIDYFYNDRTWRDVNTVSIAADVADAFSFKGEQAARFSRIQRAWDQVPYFFQEGGRGFWSAAADAVPAALLDPTNLIGFGAGKLAATAALQGAKAPVRAALSKVAMREAALNAGIEGFSEGLIQTREKALGNRESYSLGEIAESSLVAGALGSAAGTLFEIFPAIRGAKAGRALSEAMDAGDQEAIILAQRALADEIGVNNAPTLEAIQGELDKRSAADATGKPAQTQEAQKVPVRPEDEVIDALNEQRARLVRESLNNKLTPEDRANLDERINNISTQLGMLQETAKGRAQVEKLEQEIANLQMDGKEAEARLKKIELDELKFSLIRTDTDRIREARTGEELEAALAAAMERRRVGGNLLEDQKVREDVATAGDMAGAGQQRVGEVTPNNAGEGGVTDPRAATNPGQAPESDAGLQGDALRQNMQRALPAPEGSPQGPRVESDANIPTGQQVVTDNAGIEAQAGRQPNELEVKREMRLEQSGLNDGMDAEAASATASTGTTGFVSQPEPTAELVQSAFNSLVELTGRRPQDLGRDLRRLGIDRNTPEGYQALLARVEEEKVRKQASSVVAEIREVGTFTDNELSLLEELLKLRKGDDGGSIFGMAADYGPRMRTAALNELEDKLTGLPVNEQNKARAELSSALKAFDSKIGDAVAGRVDPGVLAGEIIRLTNDIADKYSGRAARVESGRVTSPGARVEQAGVDSLADKRVSTYTDPATGETVNSVKTRPATDAVNPGGQTGKEGYTVLRSDRIDAGDFAAEEARLREQQQRRTIENYQADLATAERFGKMNAGILLDAFPGKRLFDLTKAEVEAASPEVQDAFQKWNASNLKAKRIRERLAEAGVISTRDERDAAKMAATEARVTKERAPSSPEADARRDQLEAQLDDQRQAILDAEQAAKRALGDRYDNYVTGDPATKRQIKKNLGVEQKAAVLSFDKAVADLDATKIELAKLPARTVQERVTRALSDNTGKPNLSPDVAAQIIRMKQDGAPLEQIVEAFAKALNKPTPKTSVTPAADFPSGMVPALARRNAAGEVIDVEVLGRSNLDPKLTAEDYYRRLRGKTKVGDEWVEGFAPSDTANRPLAARKGFRTADEMAAGDVPGPTTAPKIRLFEDAANDVIDVGGQTVTVEQAWRAVNRAEQMPIPTTVGDLEARIKLYDDLSKGFPENIVMPRATRQEAFAALNRIYADDPVAFVNASRILSRLRVPFDMAPRIGEGVDGLDNLASFNAATNRIGISRDAANVLGETRGIPGQLVFMHEMGHWGYFNVLNFQDRADYLRFLRDSIYNDQGQIDQRKLRGLLGDRANAIPANGLSNTQELFANLFMSYLSDRSLFRAADSFWGGIGQKFKQVIDAFLNPRETPSDLLPIFRKIVADDDVIKNWEMKAYANPAEVGLTGRKLELAKATVSNMNRVTGYAQALETSIERMIATGSFDELEKSAFDLSKSLYFSIRGQHWFMPRDGYPNRETVELARDMWMRNRESYEFFRGLNKEAPAYHEMAMDKVVADIQRDFEDQMLDFIDAKRAGQIEPGVLPGQDMYASLAERLAMNADIARGGLNDAATQIELMRQSELLLQTARRYINGLETMWEKQTGKKLPPAGVLQSETRGGQNGRYTKVVQDKIKARDTKATRIEKSAEAKAETAVKKSPKRDDVPTPSKATAATATESVTTRPMNEVLKEFLSVDPESKRGIQLATEIADRRRAKPEVPLTKVPARISEMDDASLRRNLQEALNKRNSKAVDQFSSELARRGDNFGQDILNLFESRYRKAVDTEVAHTAGEMLEDGIPVNAPESFKALMRPVNHNNPEVQRKARTLLYRMLNLLGDDAKIALDNTEFLSVEAVYRLAGREAPANAKAVFADIQDPAYKELRAGVRRIAIGLTNNANPFDAIHEVGHLLSRTVLTDEQRDTMVRAFLAASSDDPIKANVKKLYADKSTMHQAEEYIAESVAQFLAERVAKGDLFKLRLDGDINAVQLKSQLEVIFDRIKEAIAYLFNRMIDNPSMRQQMRQLTFYGDLFGKARDTGRASAYAKLRNGTAHFNAAADTKEALDMMKSLDNQRYRRLMKFHSEKNADGTMKMFFHGTPNGAWLDDQAAAFRMTGRGEGYNGHGIYMTSSPDIADLSYRMEGTDQARDAAIELMRAEGRTESAVEEFRDLWDYRRHSAAKYKSALAEIENLKNSATGGNAETIARLKSKADEALENWNMFDEMLGTDYNASSRVIPVAVNIEKGFNFRVEDRYVVGSLEDDFNSIDPDLLDVLRHLDETGGLDGDTYFNNLKDLFKTDPKTGLITANGEELYRGLSYMIDMARNGMADPFRTGSYYSEGATILNDALQALGYDAVRTTHFNAPTGGQRIAHDVIVAFNTPGQVKHMLEAEMFDRAEEGLYRSRFNENEKPFMPLGGIMDSYIASDAIPQRGKFESAVYPWFEEAGAGPKMLNMFSKMMRKDPSAADTLPQFSFPLQLRSNSRRMREVSGARWLADAIAPEKGPTMFEKHASDVAKELVPMVKELESLPGADGMMKGYFRRLSDLTAGLTHRGTNQPTAFDRIVSAMRRGNMEINKLAPEEKAAAEKAVDFFARYRERLNEAGVRIGMINNYVPQLHDVDAIQRDSDRWVQIVAEHFVRMRSKDPSATQLSMADAEKSARSAMMKILDEDGLHMEVTAKGSRAPRMDNEMQRMIRLDQDPEALAALEPFLSNDLVSLMAKYADGAERRIAFMDKFGQSNHGYYDYLHTASLGRAGAVELLTTKKVYRKNVPTFGTPVDGAVEEVLMRPMPLQMASDLVDKALTMIRNGDNAEAVLAEMKAVREQFGFLPGEDRATFERRAEAIANALVDFSQTKGINATEVGFIDMAFRATQQKRVYSGPSFDNQYRVSRTLRNFNAVTMLGFSTLASLPDAVMPLIRSGSMKDFAKSWSKWASDPDYRDMIRNVGVGVETLLHERYAMLHGTGAGGLSGRRMNGFFNLTGLTPWTNVMREVAGIHGYEAFRTMIDKAQRNYRPGQVEQNRDYRIAKRFLDGYGLGDYAVDPSKRFTDLKAAQDDDQIRVAIIKFVNDSIFSPNPNDIPVWAQTPMGMIAFQLKSYPLMMGRLGADVLKRAKEGDFAPFLYMITLGTGAGAASLYLRDTLQFRGGDDERSPEARKRSLHKVMQEFGYNVDAGTINVMGAQMDLDKFLGWYAESFLAMGGLGMLLEYFYNLGQQVDNGNYGYTRALSATLGPSMNIPMNAFNVAAGVFDPDQSSNAKERTALRDAASRIPVAGNIRNVREWAADLAGPPASAGGGGRGFGGFGGGFGSGF